MTHLLNMNSVITHRAKLWQTTRFCFAPALLACLGILLYGLTANAQEADRGDRNDRFANRPRIRAGADNAVYVSRIPGIHADANFTTHKGTDDRALIQAVMDSVADREGVAEIVFDKPVAIRGGLRYHSNSRLRGVNGGGILLLPNSGNVNNFVLRNDDPPQVTYDGGGNPSYTPSYPTHDVTIEDLTIDGNRARNSAGSTDTRQPQGQLQISSLNQNVFGLCAYGVENLTLRNVTVHDSPSYAYHLATVRHVVVDGCRVEVGGTVNNPTIIYNSNQDGLHINGPASDIRVTGFSGMSGDDLIALNANDGHQSGNAPRRLYSVWNNCVWHGDITDCVFDRCKLENGLFGYRLLTITDVIDRIQILHTQGGTFQNSLTIDIFPGIGPQTGRVGTVLVDGWDFNALLWDRSKFNGGVGSGGVNPPEVTEAPTDNSDVSNTIARLGGKIDSITLRNIRRSGRASARPLVYVNDRYQQTDIGQLVVDGLTVTEGSGGEPAEAQIYVAAPFGPHTPTIGTLRVANVTWPRANSQQTRGRLVQINGGTVDAIQLQGVTAGNIAHVVDISGTKRTRVNSIRASDVRIANARATDEAFVSAGPTISRADFTNITTAGRMVNSQTRFPNVANNDANSDRNNPDRNNPDRNNTDRGNGGNGGNRTATYLSENFVGKSGRSLGGTTPAQHGGVGGRLWVALPGGEWVYTGSGAARSQSADSTALYNLESVSPNLTLRATFKTGDTNGAQIVLRSNAALTSYIAVNLDPNGVKMYDLGVSGNALPNGGPGVAANMAHSVVITLRGNTLTVTVDDNPPITNTVSNRSASNTFFGIRGYSNPGVEFSAFSISNR